MQGKKETNTQAAPEHQLTQAALMFGSAVGERINSAQPGVGRREKENYRGN